LSSIIYLRNNQETAAR